jgi:hypothetical protein
MRRSFFLTGQEVLYNDPIVWPDGARLLLNVVVNNFKIKNESVVCEY